MNPRGVLIVNGQRQTHPLERKRQFEDAVRVAAEGQGYAILTASDLFRVAYAARAGLPEDRLAQARERIAGEMAGVGRGRAALGAYGAAGLNEPRMQDRRG